MNDADGTPTHDAVAREAWIDEICDRYEDACRAGERPAIAQFLLAMQINPEAAHPNLLRELNRVEGAYKLDGTETLGPEHLAESLPRLLPRWSRKRGFLLPCSRVAELDAIVLVNRHRLPIGAQAEQIPRSILFRFHCVFATNY